MPVPPVDPDSSDLTRILAEFLRLFDQGELSSVDEFCEQYPEEVRDLVRTRCQEVLGIQRVMPEGVSLGDPIGKRIGDFVIERELGRGGMGVVYLARQISLNRKVALKVLPHHLTLSRRHIERFLKEARAVAKLNHAGIVQIHSVGEEQGIYFIAMELVEGHTLSDELRDLQAGEGEGEHGPHTLRRMQQKGHGRAVAEVVLQIARALDCAHGHGVIHRDVKPQNVLLDAEGRAKLVDFGLAKVVGEASISQSGDLAGTPYYMSPEQALAKRVQVDHRTDIFSLGVIMYEMLTMKRPFEGSTSQQVLYEITFRDPPKLHDFNPRVHPDLETLCRKALEKSPVDRFADCGELGDELQRYLDGESIHTRRPSVARRTWRWARKHRGLLGAAGCALAAAAIGFLAAWTKPATATVSVLAPGHDGAIVSYVPIDPVTGRLGHETDLDRAPIEQVSMPLGFYRFIVEVPGFGHAEHTVFLEERDEPYVIEATVLDTAEVTAEMALVPEGPFEFGAPGMGRPFHRGQRESLPAYWIDRYEVSNREYLEFVQADPRHLEFLPQTWPETYDPSWDDLPVTGVSWQGATAYAAWRGKRLATEREWEKAARGPDGRELPWAARAGTLDEIHARARVALPPPVRDWQQDPLVNDRAAYLAGVVGVRTMTQGASPFGALHMLGNAQEWTETVHTMRGVVYPLLRRVKGGNCYTSLDRFRLCSPGFSPGPECRTGFRCAKTVRR